MQVLRRIGREQDEVPDRLVHRCQTDNQQTSAHVCSICCSAHISVWAFCDFRPTLLDLQIACKTTFTVGQSGSIAGRIEGSGPAPDLKKRVENHKSVTKALSFSCVRMEGSNGGEESLDPDYPPDPPLDLMHVVCPHTWICSISELDWLVLVLNEVVDVAELVVYRVQVVVRNARAVQNPETHARRGFVFAGSSLHSSLYGGAHWLVT